MVTKLFWHKNLTNNYIKFQDTPKKSEKRGDVDLRKIRTSDFKNISDYDYVGLKHSNFLVHVFREIWLCSSEMLLAGFFPKTIFWSFSVMIFLKKSPR